MELQIWVAEATVSVPVQLQSPNGSPVKRMYVPLSGDQPDGFIELKPADGERSAKSLFWTAGDPIVWEARALVRADGPMTALLRAKEMFEHLADRLTLLTGYPVRVLSAGFVYDEDQLGRCRAGELAEYDATTGGEDTFRTQPPRNPQHGKLLFPPDVALEPIRWFRRAMLAATRVEQYLYYYIALESIARHVPNVTRGPKRDRQGNVIEGLESQESAAIRYLVSRYPNLPPNTRQVLADVRGRIAHGGTDLEAVTLAEANLPALQRLAADGIALVCGVEPEQLQVLRPRPFRELAPIAKAQYSVEKNPLSKWGEMLSDSFAQWLALAQKQSAGSDKPDAKAPGETAPG
jgi:hypothetical protein